MAVELFDNGYNPYRQLTFFEADTAEELQKLIQAQNIPCQLLSIYASNGKHYAWLIGRFKLQRRK